MKFYLGLTYYMKDVIVWPLLKKDDWIMGETKRMTMKFKRNKLDLFSITPNDIVSKARFSICTLKNSTMMPSITHPVCYVSMHACPEIHFSYLGTCDCDAVVTTYWSAMAFHKLLSSFFTC